MVQIKLQEKLLDADQQLEAANTVGVSDSLIAKVKQEKEAAQSRVASYAKWREELAK